MDYYAYRFARSLLALLLVAGLIPTMTAAQTVPLIGVLVVATPAEQDRLLIYDLGNGGMMREISLGLGWHNVWGFSPDGCRLLVTLTEGNGLGRMVTADLDGGNVRQLVTYDQLPANQWGIWEPQWSPNGEKIAFKLLRDGFEGRAERVYHIAWVTPEGGEPNFFSRTGREHTPQWSPDSQWLAYVSFEERIAGLDPFSTAAPTQVPPEGQQPVPVTTVSEADIWVVSADGETKYQLTDFSVGSVSMPRWSPDSTLVSFVYSPSPNNDTQWMIANQRGAIPTQLTFNWNLALDMTWLPDNTGIIAALRDFRGVADNRLWQLPLVGNGDEAAVAFTNDPALTSQDYPRFSPDGMLLAFRSSYGLVVMTTDVQNPRQVLLDDAHPGNTPVVWSPLGFGGESQCQQINAN